MVSSGSIVKLFQVENSHPVLSSGSFPLLDTYNTSEQMKITLLWLIVSQIVYGSESVDTNTCMLKRFLFRYVTVCLCKIYTV